MEPREQRGLVIAATKKIRQQGGKWLVPSSDATRKYTVCCGDDHCSCTCPDFEERGQACKHVYAVRVVIQRELFDDGTEVETRELTIVSGTRKTYGQDWASYNRAQTSEKSALQVLLHDLCQGIPESTEARMGRPRLSVRDGMFASCLKVYSMLSSRRFQSDLAEAHERGYLSKTPHFNSVLRVFDDPESTPVLKSLVARSAEPLAALESQFAIDSSGFSGCRFDRWFETKWGNAPEQLGKGRVWVTAHAMIGTLTNVVTAVHVTENIAGDATHLPALLTETSQRFKVAELSADKAYLSEANLQLISDNNTKAFIPFKVNNAATRPGVWNTAFHYFNLHREEFLQHYHQRSNVESTFSAIKHKFGDAVKAKNGTAMVNETLAKFVCHNLCCLIHACEEFGIDANFACTKSQTPAPKLSVI